MTSNINVGINQVLSTQKVRSVVGNPPGEVLNPKRPAVEIAGLEQSRIRFVLSSDLGHVTFCVTPHGALNVQHAQQTRTLKKIYIKNKNYPHFNGKISVLTRDDIKSMQGTLST